MSAPMDVGSDYQYYRTHRPQPKSRRPLGVTLVAAGLLLVALSAGYSFYAAYARSGLDDLVVTSTVALPNLIAPPAMDSTSPEAIYVQSQYTASPYLARALQPKDWLNASWAESPLPPPGADLVAQYLPVDWRSLPPSNSLPAPTRMRIPAINLDASVQGLKILDFGDYRAYETPKFTVGHIPETTNPGAAGNGWYFGHLESPIKKEGSIFRRLPELAELVRSGEKVYIMVDTVGTSYLYQVTRTLVVPKDSFDLTSSQEPTITLVTCIPPLVYDHRFLVEAKLVGIRPLVSS